ncbi:MAG TPA: isoprenylcysteine carboxylmethyltransferase family protein [Anaeromyxobacteraceae bacterium]|nr:isoprenylcysteine carboxylmethyltransferase family protein [Anaeromyxobacteraceae bacterium]
MVTAHAIAWAWLALTGAERLAELAVSSRNARRLLAAGAVESGRGHYRGMVAFHAAFLGACAAEPLAFPAPWPAAAAWAALAVAAAAQGLRWWAVATLGPRWSTRIVVLPGAAPVTRGPYRWLRHPNYLAVAAEIAALPLALGAWRTALAFTAGNAALLAVRIRAEEAALGEPWRDAFAGARRRQGRAGAAAGGAP